MRRLCALLLCSCGPGALPSPRLPGPALVNGTGDAGHDLAVMLVLLVDAGGNTVATCTGAFVTPRVVLTAAHCVDGLSGEARYQVWNADSYDPQTAAFTGLRESTPYASVKAAPDPLFNVNDLQSGHDLGLLLVDRALAQGITPLPLYPQRLLPGDVGSALRVVGFGLSAPGGNLLERQQATANLAIFSGEILGWEGALCSGDSGGPAFIAFQGGEALAAVASYGSPDCAAHSALQRLDTELAFASGFIAANDPQAPSGCGADGACGTFCAAPDPDCPCAADGACSALCAEPDRDPDCPLNCGRDGVCRRSGCAVPDPDCKAAGEACAADSQCASGRCTAQACARPCSAAEACPQGMVCGGDGFCAVEEAPPPAAAGGCSSAGAGGWLLLGLLLRAWRARSSAR